MRDILNTYVKCHITPIYHNLYGTHKPLFGGRRIPIIQVNHFETSNVIYRIAESLSGFNF